MSLTDVLIRSLKPESRAYKRADAGGLYLEVRPTGAKLWRFKYRYLGRDNRIALGPYPDVRQAEARQLRDEARRKLRDGIDPLAERKRVKLVAQFKAANTFGDLAREYIDKSVAEGRAEATTVKANWLLDQLKPIASMPVADIKPVEILAALKKIEARGKYETARRARSFASRVFRGLGISMQAHRMDEAHAQIAAPDTDAVDAFEGLREEMSLMVAAVKGLTSAKDKAPDYEPTLREIIRFLDDIDKRLSSMEAKPAMKLTPAVMADEFGKRAVEVRAEDRQAINSAREALARSLGLVEGLVKKGRSTEEQQWWVTRSGTGGVLTGAFLTLVAVQIAAV